MKTIAIDAKVRERIGKGGARTARREGQLPGVLYGQGKKIALTVDHKEFLTAFHEAAGEALIFDVTLPGQPPLKSIAREFQRDPVSLEFMHVDFLHIDMSKPVHVMVTVHLVGEPDGVKNYGGILEHSARELEVSCLPSNIPSHIEIDVSGMAVGDSVHVSDIKTENFEFLEEMERVVAHVASPTVEKTATDEDGAPISATVPTVAETESKEDGES